MTSTVVQVGGAEHLTTHQVARLIGVTVRSVQMMVNRGELRAWRTPGGHRRIQRESFEQWLAFRRKGTSRPKGALLSEAPDLGANSSGMTVLLIEDSVYFQSLVTTVFSEFFSDLRLHLASDGVVGLAMAGQLQPDLLIVDILLPGIDGAALITSLRSHAFFARTKLIVLTSLSEEQLEQYRIALKGVAVVHKPQMLRDLPPLIEKMLGVASLQSVQI